MTIQDSNREIINLLAEGKTTKEVAAKLKMKTRTVIDRLETLKKKHHCTTITQLVLKIMNPNLKRLKDQENV